MRHRILVHSILLFCLSTTSLGCPVAVGQYPVGKDGETMRVDALPAKDHHHKNKPHNHKDCGKNSLTSRQMTSLVVSFTNGKGEPSSRVTDVTFDATMPAHNHGMNVKAQTTKERPGVFRIDGVKLHMPGEWKLVFKVKTASGENLVEVPMTI